MLLATLFAFAGPAIAQRFPVAAPEQAKNFARIFGFDRALAGARAEVVIVHAAGDDARWEAAIGDLQGAFSGEGISNRVVVAEALAGQLDATSVAYLLPGAESPAVLAAVESAGALSISGAPELAESGHVAVALADSGGRAEIVVNVDRLEREGHELSAQLLKLARVVRGTSAAASGAAPAGGGEIAKVGDPGVQSPSLVQFDKPSYPPMAMRLRVEGDVVLRLLVDEVGKVQEVELVSGVKQNVGINEAAVEAARSARFRPGKRDGEAIKVWYTLTLPFRLTA